MKKNILLPSLLMLFIGASFVSAKPLPSQSKANAITALNVIKFKKDKSAAKICFFRCEQELANLDNAEANWELICGNYPNSVQCAQADRNLVNAGNAYNHCMDPDHWGPEGPLESRRMKTPDGKRQAGAVKGDVG